MTLLLLGCLAAARAEGPLPPPPDPTAISAADDARARELFQNGSLLYDEGRYEDAIAAWGEAWRLSGRPLLLYNMANAAERLGRWTETMDLLSRYRAFAPADEREVLDRRIGNISRRIPADLPSGATGTASVATVPPRRPLPVAPLVLFGVGGVGLAVGTVSGVRALDARAEADALCTGADETRCPDAAGPALAADRTRSLVADIGLGVGVAALGVGVVTLFVGPNAAVRLGVASGPTGALVTVGGALP